MAEYTESMTNFNHLIDDCIEQLADDRVASGVEALAELAVKWKTAGASLNSFVEICSYIEREAIAKSDSAFIEMKINAALVKSREMKRGKIVRLH